MGVLITPARWCLRECLPSRINGEGARHCIQGALQHDLNSRPNTAIGWSTRVVEMLMMLPDFCCKICLMASCDT